MIVEEYKRKKKGYEIVKVLKLSLSNYYLLEAAFERKKNGGKMNKRKRDDIIPFRGWEPVEEEEELMSGDDIPVNVLSYLQDDMGNGPTSARPLISVPMRRPLNQRFPSFSSDDDADAEDSEGPDFRPVTIIRSVCQTPSREIRRAANLDHQQNNYEIISGQLQADVAGDEEYLRLMSMVSVSGDEEGSDDDDDDDDDDDEESLLRHYTPEPEKKKRKPTPPVFITQQSSAYNTEIGGIASPSPSPPPRDYAIRDMPPEPSWNREQQPYRNAAAAGNNNPIFDEIEEGREMALPCASVNRDGAVWCFGCKWATEGFRPVDNIKIAKLVKKFVTNLLAGASTLANVAVDVSDFYEATIRKDSLELGRSMPRWPAWAVERHIRNVPEPQIRLSIMLQDLMAIIQNIQKHIIVRDRRSGKVKVDEKVGRFYLSACKEYRELLKVVPANCFGYNADFRSDPSQYATIVHPTRIAASGRSSIRPGQPASAGAPVASLPGQRGSRMPAFSESGADTGELRLPGNGEELLRRAISGVSCMDQ